MSTATSALNPVLVPDRDAGHRLLGVYETVIDGCRDELVLAFDGASLTFQVDPDADTLEPRFAATEFVPAGHRPLTGTAFDAYLGAELGWSWLALNQQGYCDTALVSFAGVTPSVMVHAIGSAVRVYGVGPTGQ